MSSHTAEKEHASQQAESNAGQENVNHSATAAKHFVDADDEILNIEPLTQEIRRVMLHGSGSRLLSSRFEDAAQCLAKLTLDTSLKSTRGPVDIASFTPLEMSFTHSGPAPQPTVLSFSPQATRHPTRRTSEQSDQGFLRRRALSRAAEPFPNSPPQVVVTPPEISMRDNYFGMRRTSSGLWGYGPMSSSSTSTNSAAVEDSFGFGHIGMSPLSARRSDSWRSIDHNLAFMNPRYQVC